MFHAGILCDFFAWSSTLELFSFICCTFLFCFGSQILYDPQIVQVSKCYGNDFGDVSLDIPLVWASCRLIRALSGPEIIFLPMQYLQLYKYKHLRMGTGDFT